MGKSGLDHAGQREFAVMQETDDHNVFFAPVRSLFPVSTRAYAAYDWRCQSLKEP